MITWKKFNNHKSLKHAFRDYYAKEHWFHLWTHMVYKSRMNDRHLCLHLVLVSFTFCHHNTSAGLHFCHSRTVLSPYKAKKQVIYCPTSAVTMNFKNTTSPDRPFPASWEQMWWDSSWSRSLLSGDISRIWTTKMNQTSPDHCCWTVSPAPCPIIFLLTGKRHVNIPKTDLEITLCVPFPILTALSYYPHSVFHHILSQSLAN